MAQSNTFAKYFACTLIILAIFIFCAHVLSIGARINQYTPMNCTYINGTLVSDPYRGAVIYAQAENPSTKLRVNTRIFHPNSPYTIFSDHRLSLFLSKWKTDKTGNCYVDMSSTAAVKPGAADRMPLAFYIIIIIPFSFLLIITIIVTANMIRRLKSSNDTTSLQVTHSPSSM